MSDNSKPVFFENIDALRFISFLVVFLFHVHLYERVSSITDAPVILAITRLLSSGGWGVTFFFVLSGFLITWLLLLEHKKNGRISTKDFYLRRIFRIWPLYYLVFIIGVFILPLLYHVLHRELFFDYNLWLYGTFLSNFGVMGLNEVYDSIRSIPLVLNISWSVSIEEQFYLIWPLFFTLLPQKRWLFIFPFFIFISILIAAIYSTNYKVIDYHTFIRMGEIAIGGWMAYAYFYKASFRDVIINLPKWLILCIYVIPSMLILVKFYGHLSLFNNYLIRMVVSFFFGIIILEQNFSFNSWYKFGRLKQFSKLGKISYGLYMLHPICMFFVGFLTDRYIGNGVIRGVSYIVLTFFATLLLAYVSYHRFEKKFLVLKARFSKI